MASSRRIGPFGLGLENGRFRRNLAVGLCVGEGAESILWSHSACVISVSSLFAKLPQWDAMQTPEEVAATLGLQLPQRGR